MTTANAGRVVDTVFDTITDALTKGTKVKISRFGKFEVAVQKARTFRTPQGAIVAKPDMKKVKFGPLKDLKESVAGA